MIDIKKTLDVLGIKASNNGTSTGAVSFGGGEEIDSFSPVDGNLIGKVTETTPEEFEKVMQAATAAFKDWRLKPAPLRGEIVRQYGEKLRKYKQPLGGLVSYEMGKSLQEGLGEVQEMIDICDFAVGLSRQLHGLTMHSERPGHRMYEQYHPLGVVGIISAFNFPVAVWCWNTALAWIAGDTCVWKASEKVPLCAIACQNIWNEVAKENDLPEGIYFKTSRRMATVPALFNEEDIYESIKLKGLLGVGVHRFNGTFEHYQDFKTIKDVINNIAFSDKDTYLYNNNIYNRKITVSEANIILNNIKECIWNEKTKKMILIANQLKLRI